MLLFILAPLYLMILKTKKWLGYIMLGFTLIVSIVFSYTIASYKQINFYPNLIFNNKNDYIFHFQMNPLVRANNFYLGISLIIIGLLIGIFIINGLEK
jgi:hypothetical protein